MSESIDVIIDRKVRERVDAALDERLAALRPLLLRDKQGEGEPGEFGGARDVARLMGLDISTPEAIRSVTNKVYYYARIGNLPSTRIGKKKVIFDLDKIKKLLSEGGIGNS